MPKETFFNLPEAKRQRITNAALEEFAAGSYGQASLTRIVRRAGIAKGSIYQYFEDKFDLYFYLLSIALERKLLCIKEAIDALGPEPDFFAILEAAIGGGFRLAREDPRLLALGNRLVLEPDVDVRERVMTHIGTTGEGTIEAWIRQGVERGQIDPGVKPATAARVIWAAGSVVSQDLAAGRLSVAQAEELFGEIMDVLEHGLRPRDHKRGESPK